MPPGWTNLPLQHFENKEIRDVFTTIQNRLNELENLISGAFEQTLNQNSPSVLITTTINKTLDHGLLSGLIPVNANRNDDHTDLMNLTPQTNTRNIVNPAAGSSLDLGLRINGNFSLGSNPNVNHSGITGAGSILNGMWFDSTFMEKSITGDNSSGNLRISCNVAHDGTQSGGSDDFGLVNTAKNGVTLALAPTAGGLVFYKESDVTGDGQAFPAFRYRTSGLHVKYYGNFMFGKPDSGGEVPIDATFPINGGSGQFNPRVEIHTSNATDSANGLLIYTDVANTGTPPDDPIPLIIHVAGTSTEMMLLHRSTGAVNKTMRVTIPNDDTDTRAEIVFDGKKLNLDVTGMASYPSSSTTDSGVLIKQKLEFVDQDSTPVENLRLAVVDGFIVCTDTVDVEVAKISSSSIQGGGGGGSGDSFLEWSGL